MRTGNRTDHPPPADIRRTQDFWSEKYGRPISETEAMEIQRNLFGYFELLGKWHKESVENQLEIARHNEVGSQG